MRQLSLNDKEIYGVVRRLRKLVNRAQKEKAKLMLRLKRAEKWIQEGSWDTISAMPETSRNFIISQFRNVNRNKYHRKFTMKDKVFALALFKRSPNAYRFMQQIFLLPSVETLRKVVFNIPIDTGICSFLFQAMEDKPLDYRIN